MSSTYATPVEEAQQMTTEGQQLFQRSLSAPLQQFTSFQRDVARLLLENLEFQAAVQRQSIDLARSAVRSYVDALEATAGPDRRPGGQQQYQAPPQAQQSQQRHPTQPFQQSPQQYQPPRQQHQPSPPQYQQPPDWQQAQTPPQQTQRPGWQQTPTPEW
ncbi:hypothetical protein ACFQH6_14600 [Halobacteriaceae archaeon GCM10025711]